MRVALVTPACHFPSYGAVQQDIYSLIGLLQERGHLVSVVTLDQPGQSAGIIDGVAKQYQCSFTKFLPTKKILSQVFSSIFHFYNFDGSTWAFTELVKSNVWQKFADSFKPQMVVSIGTYSWPVARWAKQNNIPAVVRSHNFEPWHFWEELNAKQKINPLNWLRLAAKYVSEVKAVKLGVAIAAISPKELGEYKAVSPKANVKLLPLVSLINFKPTAKSTGVKPIIDVFFLSASYNVPFHRAGAAEYVKNIVPAVNKAAPGKFRFHLAGGKLPQELIADCAKNECVYEGYVANLDDFFGKMDAGVFPEWSGRGMKQKIFEAIARGFPVVVPEPTIGGYSLVDGQSALVVKHPKDLAQAVLKLTDPVTRAKLSTGAAAYAKENFSKEKIISDLTAFNL